MKKKAKTIRLQIPEPCSQKFTDMTPLPGGRYCDKCEKTVVDIRQMSDGEIIRLYQKRQGRVCGIFRDDQLEREMFLPLPVERGKNWKAIAAVASGLFLSQGLDAQTLGLVAPAREKTEICTPKPPPPTSTKPLLVKGLVKDENGLPLPFVTVFSSATNGTVTEVDGTFTLEIPADKMEYSLTFYFLGYETVTLPVKDWQDPAPMVLTMRPATMMLPVVEVTAFAGFERAGKILTGITLSDLSQVPEKDSLETPPENTPLVSVFPNPFISSVFIEMDIQKPGAFLFHLYNEAGQLVFTKMRNLPAGQQKVELDLAQRHLPDGIYFLRISDRIAEIKTKKIVKVNPK